MSGRLLIPKSKLTYWKFYKTNLYWPLWEV